MFDLIYRFFFPHRVTFYTKSGNVITVRARAPEDILIFAKGQESDPIKNFVFDDSAVM